MFGLLSTVAFTFGMVLFMIKPIRKLVEWYIPAGQGPSKHVREKGHFTMKFHGKGLSVFL